MWAAGCGGFGWAVHKAPPPGPAAHAQFPPSCVRRSAAAGAHPPHRLPRRHQQEQACLQAQAGRPSAGRAAACAPLTGVQPAPTALNELAGLRQAELWGAVLRLQKQSSQLRRQGAAGATAVLGPRTGASAGPRKAKSKKPRSRKQGRRQAGGGGVACRPKVAKRRRGRQSRPQLMARVAHWPYFINPGQASPRGCHVAPPITPLTARPRCRARPRQRMHW
jgi:hypothetical protein